MATPASNNRNGAILIVDDDPASVKVLLHTLEGRGHHVLTARGGEEAIALARRTQPELILLDVMMPPGIDGYETLRRLKASDETESTSVILLSSLGETRNKLQGFVLGAVDYVAKPFEREEVVARVETHLKLRQLQRDLESRNRDLKEANERMAHDLQAAARVQHALLPDALPETEDFSFAWAYRPCAELGGDALGIFGIDDDHIAAYLLDVSGHGVSASLLAVAVTRSLEPRADRASLVIEGGFNGEARRIASPAEVMRRLNILFPWEKKRNPHFITAIYGVLDTRAGDFTYACAGHPSPIAVRAGGEAQIIEGGSLPLGILGDTQYEEMRIAIAPGDLLLLLSDGVYEQRNTDRAEFGLHRVIERIKRVGEPIDRRIDDLVDDVERWSRPMGLRDDVSIVAMSRRQRD